MTLQSPIGSARAQAHEVLSRLGVAETLWTGGDRPVRSPVTGETIAEVHDASPVSTVLAVEMAQAASMAIETRSQRVFCIGPYRSIGLQQTRRPFQESGAY